MNIIFKSVLKEEMFSFIEFIKLSVIDWKSFLRTLSSLDSFLHTQNSMEKNLDAQQLACWLDGLNVQLSTKQSKLSHIRRFSGYLSTLGITIRLPELPRNTGEFKPYVFSADEMARIFETADDYMLTSLNLNIAAEFPLLLRILYGCGLRLGEALSLKWDDVELPAGIITVKAAKHRKQRIVPMGGELVRILSLHRTALCFADEGHSLILKKHNGQRRSNGSYYSIFSRILYELGIKNLQTMKYGSRGPRIHSLRHTFTLHSLLKAESEGRGFMETVPFLSTYLGHEKLMHTDKYLKARHELYTKSHTTITDYTRDVFPQEL